MNYFVITLLFGLTLTPIVVSQTMDFCTKYGFLAETVGSQRGDPNRRDYALPEFKFIATKDQLYLYLSDQPWQNVATSAEELIYKLDVSCDTSDNCPKIGDTSEEFSKKFPNLMGMKDAFLHNGYTYFFTKSSLGKVVKFENDKEVEQIPEADFWKNITHATVYKWENNKKIVLSRFIPPHSPEGGPQYGFSFDTFDGNLTVELNGNYNGINICKHQYIDFGHFMTLYSFGDYLVPTQFYGYLPLPNGDDIFNFEPYPGYVRKDNARLLLHRQQNLYEMFCLKADIKQKILRDTTGDNIYPKYWG